MSKALISYSMQQNQQQPGTQPEGFWGQNISSVDFSLIFLGIFEIFFKFSRIIFGYALGSNDTIRVKNVSGNSQKNSMKFYFILLFFLL